MGGGGGGSPAASGGGSPAASGSGSSSEDDGDAAWKAAIDSIASVGFGVPSSNGVAKAASGGSGEADTDAELEQPHEGKPQAPRLKLYQIKVPSFSSRLQSLICESCNPFVPWRN